MSNQLARHELMFNIHYSHSLADMNACYYQRISSSITFLSILLGTTVMATNLNSLFVGFLVTAFSTFSFVVKPGEKGVLFQIQQKRYIELIETSLSDTELMQAFQVIQKDDLKTIRNFEAAAYIRAGKIMGLDVSDKQLTRFQFFMTHLGGETLKRKDN
ncbi:hypothetical protein PVK64_19020 [Aliivibrio sp. S4TY2]|uniref:hypothetical protein n=1 Tax=unclassified Aliivibrio TaxID=2645654 RepID=UPI0023784E31|nr:MULTISPECIES: hypothetical protein [unclassified Aliivibrio]MDD9158259.1 hypothetical protein [Aliivibrio sp. S4TY2]MDD9162174.1 hypothetical protein [Aliivibrio sp. S4TY1]MDD9166212.1 hypothetical protein [Aliivibrio sp. S4MY2]MDD9170210.1 hypothetical protein [Aliivibrio sp. S4MY4]MDD9187261.1 hypothetical protein [Aliivibrio sp. S4MY3]